MGDPVEVWDVRRGYIAKWTIKGSAVEGGVTGMSTPNTWNWFSVGLNSAY
jgi:WD repeat-containing protein 24